MKLKTSILDKLICKCKCNEANIATRPDLKSIPNSILNFHFTYPFQPLQLKKKETIRQLNMTSILISR